MEENNVNKEQIPEQQANSPVSLQNMKCCKSCGNMIAKNAKVCPSCGAKNKKPVFKRVWFWLLVIVVLGGNCFHSRWFIK